MQPKEKHAAREQRADARAFGDFARHIRFRSSFSRLCDDFSPTKLERPGAACALGWRFSVAVALGPQAAAADCKVSSVLANARERPEASAKLTPDLRNRRRAPRPSRTKNPCATVVGARRWEELGSGRRYEAARRAASRATPAAAAVAAAAVVAVTRARLSLLVRAAATRRCSQLVSRSN